MASIVGGVPIAFRIFQRVWRSTESYALAMSRKAKNKGNCFSLHDCWSNFAVKIMSTVFLPFRKPHCDSGRSEILSQYAYSRVFKSKVRILLTYEMRLMPLWFLHWLLSPFLYIEQRISSRNDSGISRVSQIRVISLKTAEVKNFDTVYFRSSIEITSVPDLRFFALLMAL